MYFVSKAVGVAQRLNKKGECTIWLPDPLEFSREI